MRIPAAEWYKAIETRRSRRIFEQKHLEARFLSQMAAACENFRPFPATRSVLITESSDSVFKGAIGPFGKVKDAPAFIAFIGDMDNPNVYEQTGYTGEGIILEAEALKLATCWVGGFFKRKVVASLTDIGRNERILAVTPVGYASQRLSLEEKMMTGFGLSHRRKALSDLVSGLGETEWPQWIKAALDAARLAPSAVNRQPWRFNLSENSITVSVNSSGREYGQPKRLCCGIAMLHIEVAASFCNVSGKWDLLDPPSVARFTVDNK